MIYRLGILMGVCSLISCSPKAQDSELIEENYNYYSQSISDSVKCLQIGKQYVNEQNVISFSAVQHESVDETPAKVKLKGKILSWYDDSILIQLQKDSIWVVTSFKKENSKPFIGLNSVFQGVLKMHPRIDFKVDGLLIEGISKQK